MTQEPQPGPFERADALVSVDELVSHMSGASLTERQRDDAAYVLSGLQRSLERYCNRRFTSAAVEGERTFTDQDGYALLRRTPVRQVTSVGVVEAAYESRRFDATRDGVRTGHPLTWLLVSYVGGFDGDLDSSDLDDVRLAIMDKAADYMTPRHDDVRGVRGVNVAPTEASRQPPPTKPFFTLEEKQAFDRLRRRVVL